MKNIKEQISAIIVYNCNTIEELEEQFANIETRLKEGFDKMRNSQLFTDKEYDEAYRYSRDLANQRYFSARKDLIGTMKSEFKF